MSQARPLDSRSQIEAVLSGQQPERMPAIFRLSRWYRQRRHEGTLPAELRDARLEDVEDYLGLARSARYAKVYRIEHRSPVECRVHDEGNQIITEYRVGKRVFWRVARYDPGDRNEWIRYAPGTGPGLFSIDGVTASCMICADGEAPRCVERVKALKPQACRFSRYRPQR